MKTSRKVSRQIIELQKLISGGLLGLSTVAVIQLLGQTSVDTALLISLYCFSVSIPLLSWTFMANYLKSFYKHEPSNVVEENSNVVGSLGALLGIGSVFWHFSPFMACLFAVATGFSYFSFLRFDTEIERLNKQTNE